MLTPVLVGIAFLAGWEALVRLQRHPAVPAARGRPRSGSRSSDNGSEILDSARVTGANALVGLLAGAVLGILAALVASRFRVVDSLLVPLAAAVNAMPIIALAPIFNTMFSTTSSVPRRLVVTLVVFFPLFINALRGLRQVAPIHRELMDSYAAGGWTFARVVRIPNALPFVFTGLRLASVAGGHRRRRRRVLRRCPEWTRHPDHLGRLQHRLPAGVGVRRRRLRARPRLLPRRDRCSNGSRCPGAPARPPSPEPPAPHRSGARTLIRPVPPRSRHEKTRPRAGDRRRR